MTIKGIFFDIDDTLYSTTTFADRARRSAVAAMRRHGLRLPADHILRELEEVLSEFSANYEHHFDKLLLRLPRSATEGVNRAILVASGVQAYHDAKFRLLKPYRDVPPVLRKLARTDLLCGVITAGLEVKQAEKLLRLGLYPYFCPTAIFISEQVGISKPNPKLFQRACDDTGLSPRETVYVGDHPLHDIDPANRLGMITVHVRRGKHAGQRGKTRPRHSVKDFTEFLTLLRKVYRVRA